MTHPLPLAAAALVLAAPTFAQGPPVDTSFLKRYAETRGFMLGRPAKPKFTPDGKTVLFLRAAGPTTPRQALFEFDVATGKTRELLSAETLLKGAAEELSPEEKARRERQRLSVGGFADYHIDEAGGRVLVMLGGKVYVFERATGKVWELKAGPGTIVDPKWSPDGKYVSYVRDYDVMAYDLAADKELPVTSGGTSVKTHGLAEFVAQEEMDRHTGYWWSPDSKSIAYEEADHTGVEMWYIADPLRPDQPPRPQYYPRPGKKNVAVRLGVVPVAGGATVWVGWDRAAYEYMAAVRWDKRGGLTIVVQSRNQRVLRLLQAAPPTGAVRLLHQDVDPAWVNIHQRVPRWYDASRFVWITDHDGTARLYLAERHADNKQQLSPVTGPDLQVSDLAELIDFPRGTSTPIVQGTLDPTTTASWLVLTKRGRGYMTNAPLGVGLQTIACSPDHSLRAVTFTSLKDMPRMMFEHEPGSEGTTTTLLPSVAADPPFTPNVVIEKVGDLYTAVVRPRDFDPKKQYPVVVDVYGGPHHLHVQQAMRNWLIPQWVADQGFIVVAIDNRGTPGRGRDWERAIYQKFGTVPLEDQVKGLHALCDKHPELDRTRVGIVGWSFGGYMAANAVLRRPDVYKAAVAGAPVTDWEDYDTHYTERYLGLLPESQKAYDEASLLPLAKNLSRPLLLVHGTADDNVYYRHTLKLSDALFRAGKAFEVLPLPGVTHMYSADPEVTERLWARTVGFFQQHLGTPR